LTRILLAAEAVQDLAEGMAFYETQQEGLGDYFLNCLAADIESLAVTAAIHRKVYRDYFRLLSRVFPYAVYYTGNKETVTVWAVLDCRRNPSWIADHLKGKGKA
jgi:plasmid stabilization system protein ParE